MHIFVYVSRNTAAVRLLVLNGMTQNIALHLQFVYYFYWFSGDSIRYLFGRRERWVLFSTLPDLFFRSRSQNKKKKQPNKPTNSKQKKTKTKTKTNRKKHITIKEATTLKGDF